jgi:hypothetical protein
VTGGTRWRGARREVVVAIALVTTVTAATWVLVGPQIAGLAVLGCGAAVLAVLRMLLAPAAEPDTVPARLRPGPPTTFTGLWRAQADLADATKSLAAWHFGIRPRLQNLLAARLAERHGISLAADPDAARRVLNSGTRHDLWSWMDPLRPLPPDPSSQPGIPSGLLAALIDRLEQL